MEQCGGTVEQCWWKSETVTVEQCNSVGLTVEKWNSESGTVWCNGGTVEQCWLNSGTVIGEQCGGSVEQCWWNSVVEQWNSVGGTMWWNSGTVLVDHS